MLQPEDSFRPSSAVGDLPTASEVASASGRRSVAATESQVVKIGSNKDIFRSKKRFFFFRSYRPHLPPPLPGWCPRRSRA